ncbi:pectate lyase-like adhesive domain-containing protein [Vagococcus salmoninarum]|uniref:DUF11 domain-containing protein n=2 Tax=Vagococcus salmoninarum TaxID=2739 RepID=A0A429ZNC6_9ENTE|nr:isopeptide-forming domain-containing fimbrial protein [Vagococcus salmoninarum]RST95195.1 hypothetical protein CBF35_08400 [Vagococcus salmoninarum]
MEKKKKFWLMIIGLVAMLSFTVFKESSKLKASETDQSSFELSLINNEVNTNDDLIVDLNIKTGNQESLTIKMSEGLTLQESTFENISELEGISIELLKENAAIIKTENVVKDTSIKLLFNSSEVGPHKLEFSSNDKVIKEFDVTVLEEEIEEVKNEINKLASTKSTYAGEEINVGTWQEFVDGIANSNVGTINVTQSIKNPNPAGSVTSATVGTLNRSLKIQGVVNGGVKPVIDFGDTKGIRSPGLTLASGSGAKELSLNNVEFKGRDTLSNGRASEGAMIYSNDTSSSWTINHSGFEYKYGSTKRYIYGPTISVVFDGEKTTIKNDYNTAPNTSASTTVSDSWSRLIEARNLLITNQTEVEVETVDIFFLTTYTGGTNRENGTSVVIEKGSSLVGSNKKTAFIIAEKAPYFNFYVQGDLDNPDNKSQSSKVEINANTKYTDRYGGAITVEGSYAHYKIDQESELIVNSRWSPSTVMMSQYGVFDVDNKSKLTATALSDDGYSLGGTIRFRDQGDMTFNILNESELSIVKKDINASGNAATANRGAAIRMFGGNNIVNVSGSSKMFIDNNSNEYAIQYTSGGGNQFNLKDKNSRVVINSHRSGGLGGQQVNIVGESGTEFQVVSGGTDPAFDYGNDSVLEFDNMLYYDFSQTNQRNVFATNRAVLNSINSDASIWGNKSRLDGNPDKAWTLIDIGASKRNLATINAQFQMELMPGQVGNTYYSDNDARQVLTTRGSRFEDLSRFSGNNAKPIVDELRVPTNADKNIYGHVSVPEGVEGIRDAWTDEVTVALKVTKTDGTSYELYGKTIGTDGNSNGLSVYGEPARGGMFTVPSENNEFFKTGDKVEVLRAWRGGAGGEVNPNPAKTHIGYPEDNDLWVKEAAVAEDVTPPSNLKVDTLSNSSKQISGTLGEDAAHIFVKLNDEWLKNSDGSLMTGRSENGKWQIDLPAYFSKEDKVEVYAKDESELTDQLINPPTSNTLEPNQKYGNLVISTANYGAYQGFHDAIKNGSKDERFESGKMVQVTDLIPSLPVVTKKVVSDTLDGGNNQITQVGSELTYTITIKNNDTVASNKIWYDAALDDTLPVGLAFSLEKGEVKINDQVAAADLVTYKADDRQLIVKLGDLKPQETATVSFKTTVTREAVDTVVENIAWGTGHSPQETPFVPGPINPDSEHVIIKDKGSVVNPGGTVAGQLMLESAPTEVDFGTVDVIDFQKKISVNNADMATPLLVEDTRKSRTPWHITAEVVKEMINGDDEHIGALKYRYNGKDLTLDSSIKTVYANDADTDDYLFNISDSWGKTANSEGLKLVMDPVKVPKTTGSYEGIIRWTLRDTIE